MTTTFQIFNVTDRITYSDSRGTKTGEVIEVKEDGSRCRIRWDDNRRRTWIRSTSLTKINTVK